MNPTGNLFVTHNAKSKTESARRVRSLAGMTVALLFSAFMLLPYSAKAQCAAGWNVGGKWFMNQGGTPVNMDLVQTGGLVKGTARYFNSGIFRDTVEVYGDVEGTVKNDDFNVHIYWREPLVGLSSVYSGKISPQGRIDGEGYGTEKPSKTFAWFSSVQMKCPPQPRVIKSTGHPKADPTPPAKTVKTTGRPIVTDPAPNPVVEPSAATPQISASPNNAAFVPGKIGHTVIRWDGGPDHPYAELWVRWTIRTRSS